MGRCRDQTADRPVAYWLEGMVQTTNPKGAVKTEVVGIIPWLQVRILPVLLIDLIHEFLVATGPSARRPMWRFVGCQCLAQAIWQLAQPSEVPHFDFSEVPHPGPHPSSTRRANRLAATRC